MKIPVISLAALLLFRGATTVFGASMEKPVYDSPAQVQPLKVGEKVAGGALKGIDGRGLELASLVGRKPSVIIFYRGGWCPFCNLQMGQLVKIEPELAKLGYQILAITPDSPESLKASLEKHKINYTLLSDPAMKVTQAFGLAYHMGDAMVAGILGLGHDIDKATGNTLHELPVPAAYVVDTRGLIHFVYYNADIKVRVNPDDLLAAAKKAKG
jgi:peroxiredoxin